MNIVKNISELEQLYDEALERSLKKVTPVITPMYQLWIEASRFLVISTVGEEGCDSSPRGDLDTLVKIPNNNTLWLPDWRGNNRLDSLRNIVRDGRVSLMFLVNGCNNVVRINGCAVLTTDKQITEVFARNGKWSDLWNGISAPNKLPTAGEFTKEQDGSFDSSAYDKGYAEYAKNRLW